MGTVVVDSTAALVQEAFARWEDALVARSLVHCDASDGRRHRAVVPRQTTAVCAATCLALGDHFQPQVTGQCAPPDNDLLHRSEKG